MDPLSLSLTSPEQVLEAQYLAFSACILEITARNTAVALQMLLGAAALFPVAVALLCWTGSLLNRRRAVIPTASLIPANQPISQILTQNHPVPRFSGTTLETPLT